MFVTWYERQRFVLKYDNATYAPLWKEKQKFSGLFFPYFHKSTAQMFLLNCKLETWGGGNGYHQPPSHFQYSITMITIMNIWSCLVMLFTILCFYVNVSWVHRWGGGLRHQLLRSLNWMYFPIGHCVLLPWIQAFLKLWNRFQFDYKNYLSL